MLARRVRLLVEIASGQRTVVASRALVEKYGRQVPQPRNDFVAAFLALLVRPGGCIWNWASHGRVRVGAGRCRFPRHDLHVLRTAVGRPESEILTEEGALLRTDECIHREFGVHVREP